MKSFTALWTYICHGILFPYVVVSSSLPTLLWTKQLFGTGNISEPGLRQGNGVVTSKDGTQLYITDEEGRLHILNTHNPERDIVFVPPIVEESTIECRSSVSLFEWSLDEKDFSTGDGESSSTVIFAVYAVLDIPWSNSTSSISKRQSRIIAINPDGSLRWIQSILGIAMGTPVIGTMGYVYTTHNNVDHQGYFSILSQEDDNYDDVDLSVEVQTFINPVPVPHGPISITRKPNDDNAENNNYWEDLLVWGESLLYEHIPPLSSPSREGRLFQANVSKNCGVRIRSTIQHIGMKMLVAPTLSQDGTHIWMVGSDARIMGHDYNHNFTWVQQLDTSRHYEHMPLQNEAALDASESFLYLASASTSFYRLNARTGEVLWKTKSPSSVFRNSFKLSKDESKLYSIEHADGTVRETNATTGDTLWKWSCRDIPIDHVSSGRNYNPICQDSVEAEFSLSSDGRFLFYGDIFGRIVALQISYPQIPMSPSISPSTIPSRTRKRSKASAKTHYNSNIYFSNDYIDVHVLSSHPHPHHSSMPSISPMKMSSHTSSILHPCLNLTNSSLWMWEMLLKDAAAIAPSESPHDSTQSPSLFHPSGLPSTWQPTLIPVLDSVSPISAPIMTVTSATAAANATDHLTNTPSIWMSHVSSNFPTEKDSLPPSARPFPMPSDRPTITTTIPTNNFHNMTTNHGSTEVGFFDLSQDTLAPSKAPMSWIQQDHLVDKHNKIDDSNISSSDASVISFLYPMMFVSGLTIVLFQ